jgi:hypothetical protein
MKTVKVLAVMLLTAAAVVPPVAGQDVARLNDPALSGQAGGPAGQVSPGVAAPYNAYFSGVEASRIRDSVRGQIEALTEGDATRAFALLAPSAQSYYGTPQGFIIALVQNLAPVLTARGFALGEIERDSADAVQLVQFTGADGALWLARFTVERQPDGLWAIKRCLVGAAQAEPRV